MTLQEKIDALRAEIAALRHVNREYERAHDDMRTQRDTARAIEKFMERRAIRAEREEAALLAALERILAGEA